MFELKPHHMQVFEALEHQRFRKTLHQFLLHKYPDDWADDDEHLNTMEKLIETAMSYELTAETDVQFFADLSLSLGIGFEYQKNAKPLLDVLQNTHRNNVFKTNALTEYAVFSNIENY